MYQPPDVAAAIASTNATARRRGSLVHRESPHHTPDRPPSPHLWIVTVHVVDQHIHRTRRHLLHCPWHSILYRGCSRGDVFLRASVPNAGISLSGIASDIHGMDREIGRRTIMHHDSFCSFPSIECSKTQNRELPKAFRAPIATNNTYHQPRTSRDGPRATARNLENL